MAKKFSHHVKKAAKFCRRVSRTSQTQKFKRRFAGLVLVLIILGIFLSIPAARQYLASHPTYASKTPPVAWR